VSAGYRDLTDAQRSVSGRAHGVRHDAARRRPGRRSVPRREARQHRARRVRRRVQNETLGHRGRRDDPLWRARRRFSIARERLTADQHDRLMGLLRAGDPHQEVWFAWNAKEVVRQIYDHTDAELAAEWVAEIGRDFTDPEMPFEVRRLGRTITRWAGQIVAWHRSHVTNGPTEAVNNLAKRIKRVAFGLVNFRHHRVRCLLYAGKPDWTLPPTIQP
jgi:transposase